MLFVCWFPWQLRTCRLSVELCFVKCVGFVADMYVLICMVVVAVLLCIKVWLLELLRKGQCRAVTEVKQWSEDVDCFLEHLERLSPWVSVCLKMSE
jgi:hypothetical protein